MGLHARRRHTQHESQVRHEAIVRPKDRCAERARQGLARLRSQGTDDLGVNVLVRLHVRRHVIIHVAGGTLLRVLGHRQNEDRAEKVGEDGRGARAQRRLGSRQSVVAQARQPILLVAALRLLKLQEDRALLTRPALGQIAVGASLHAFLSQVPTPALNLRARGLLAVSLLVCAHGLAPSRPQRWVVEEVACASTVVGWEAGAPKRRSLTASATLSVTCSPPARTRSDIF